MIRSLPNGKIFELIDTEKPFKDHISPQCKTGGIEIRTVNGEGESRWLDNVETWEDAEHFLTLVGRK